MSWRFKLYDIEPDHVVSIEPINENFQPFVEELSGGLNEHNFSASAFTLANFADDAALRLHQSFAEVGVGRMGDTNPGGANWVEIQAQDGWQSFGDDGLRLEFTGRGGPAYICASLNLYCSMSTTYKGTAKFRQMGFGYLVALRVNGSVLNETILGSGDLSQDDFRSDEFSQKANSVTRSNPGRHPIAALPQGGGGLAGARLPVVVDAVIDMLPGINLVEVVVMNIRGSMQRAVPLAGETYTAELTYVGQRELFVLEMVR